MDPITPKLQNNTNKKARAPGIKDAYVYTINLEHPKIKHQTVPPEVKRTKFTIIGDRVTEEFIYCTNLVKRLYKYRKNIFEAPLIQGVTTVEWPIILNDLKVKYKGQAFCLTSSVAVLINEKLLGGEKELRKLIESKFTYALCLDYYKESVAEFAKFIRGSGRPFAYMNISIDGKPIGTLIFMLYADVLPHTCANFLRLCKDTKGGYSGTPIHRIVKDGWIQGGGFGLKETDLNCENFVIPHDRRGVLGMANSGPHMECSTQFFVLLQPASWMAKKFVAFGQLIEGKGTLEKIEAVPTWYESPTSIIIIYKAGIFNMESQDIMINKGTKEYIYNHIEDLNELGELLYEDLIEKVFLTAQLRELEKLKEQQGEGGEQEEDANARLRETRRFNRRKEDIEKQLQISSNQTTATVSHQTASIAQAASYHENNDYDVETYDPEYEETDYQHQSINAPSLVVKPIKPFYLPLIDVNYPGEKRSEFDLKRFLQGDYCLESDIKEPPKAPIPRAARFSYSSCQVVVESDTKYDSDDDDREVKDYIKDNIDRVSYAGSIVKNIGRAKPMSNIFESTHKSDLISDDQLRKLRLASRDFKSYEKKVSICVPSQEVNQSPDTDTKRQQAGFVCHEDVAKLKQSVKREFGDDDDDKYGDTKDNDDTEKKVRIAPNTEAAPAQAIIRRPTGYERSKFKTNNDEKVSMPSNQFTPPTSSGTTVPKQKKRPIEFIEETQKRPIAFGALRNTDKPISYGPSTATQDYDSDVDYTNDRDDNYGTDDNRTNLRESVLLRLFEEWKEDDDPPTLKHYKPTTESQARNLLTISSNYRIKSEPESKKERYIRRSLTVARDSYDQVLNIQHGKKMTRKISSDYVKTIDQIENRLDISIGSVEFAKTRPTISVVEYQQKNREYQEAKKKINGP